MAKKRLNKDKLKGAVLVETSGNGNRTISSDKDDEATFNIIAKKMKKPHISKKNDQSVIKEGITRALSSLFGKKKLSKDSKVQAVKKFISKKRKT